MTARGAGGQPMDSAPQYEADRSAPPATLVIFGASGDLTRRKLIPAVANLARHHRLPREVAVVGVARTHMDDERFRDTVVGDAGLGALSQLDGGLRYLSGGYDDPDTYKRLGAPLDELGEQ